MPAPGSRPLLGRLADELDAGSLADGAGQDVSRRPARHAADAHGDDVTRPALPSRARSLLAQMQAYAMEHLREPDMGPERIARAHFVSTRYVHKLFRAEGATVSGWIRGHGSRGAA